MCLLSLSHKTISLPNLSEAAQPERLSYPETRTTNLYLFFLLESAALALVSPYILLLHKVILIGFKLFLFVELQARHDLRKGKL